MRSGAKGLAVVTGASLALVVAVALGSECKGPLEPTVAGQCQGVSAVGCCDVLGRVWWCEPEGLFCADCYAEFPSCGWSNKGYYDCGANAGSEDPSGANPYSCDQCGPGCPEGAACSAECSGGCGVCAGEGEVCLESGNCYKPQCDGRECGTDAMGFSCGSCPFGTECVDALGECLSLPEACVPTTQAGCPGCDCEACVCAIRPECCSHHWDVTCVTLCDVQCGYDCSPCPENPSCEGLECGSYCGVQCGVCSGPTEICFQYHCCTPQCEGAVCGPDGCGGECGQCGGYDQCVNGACVPCQPQCEGVECGSDGCGGECGQCSGAELCIDGACLESSCQGSCGGQSAFGCFCDSACLDYGDCCADLCVACPEMCAGADACKGIPAKGCCQGNTLVTCDSMGVLTHECSNEPLCGWNGGSFRYECNTDGTADPSGALPMDCQVWCDQWCVGRSCGVSGCGESCGECEEGQVCSSEGQCCTPNCKGMECGGDGCGGICGECPQGWACESGLCTEACSGISYQGCCDGEKLRYCDNGHLQEQSCAGMGPCGWDSGAGYYNCGTAGEVDPSGQYAKVCPGGCEPSCGGRECGDDGCGGVCGVCGDEEICSGAGVCESVGVESEQDVVVLPDVPVTDVPGETRADGAVEIVSDVRDVSGNEVDGHLSGDGDSSGDVSEVPKSGSGGCTSGANATPRSMAGVLLLVGLGLLFRGRRWWRWMVLLLVPGLLLLAGCSSNSDADVQVADSVADAPSQELVSDLRAADGMGDGGVPGDLVELVDSLLPTDMDAASDVQETVDAEDDEVEVVDVDGGDIQGDTDVVEPPPVDCDNLPEGPFELELIPGVVASEDLAFDGEGALVGSDDTAIYKSTVDGHVKIFVPNLQFRAGMRFLPSGSLVVADNTLGRLVLVSPEGVMTTLLDGLAYPNGIAVDLNGYVYVSEHDAGRVLRVHPGTGAYTVIANQVTNPNGLCFSPDYKTLYIGSFGSGWVYALSLDQDGTPGRLTEWGDMTETPGMLDGIGVDACGNVYVCEYGETKVYRIPATGGKGVLIATGVDTYLPNMQWGRGPGWDPLSLYLPDGWSKEGVWRLKVGVPSAALAYP